MKPLKKTNIAILAFIILGAVLVVLGLFVFGADTDENQNNTITEVVEEPTSEQKQLINDMSNRVGNSIDKASI